jgi:DNA-binding NarL/FixJ family response regulator
MDSSTPKSAQWGGLEFLKGHLAHEKKSPSRRVLIVASGSLFDEGIKSLLRRERDLEVTSVSYTDDSAFSQEVLLKQPEVVILFEGGSLGVSRVFELIKEIPHLVAMRVITILSDSSTIEMYEKQQIPASKTDTLLALIRHSRQNNQYSSQAK